MWKMWTLWIKGTSGRKSKERNKAVIHKKEKNIHSPKADRIAAGTVDNVEN